MLTMHSITKPIRSAAPTFEPVTLARAKQQIDMADAVGLRDEQITALIVAAREKVEHDALVVCCTGTYTMKLTGWDGDSFELPRSLRPITSITSIAYVASDGTSTTWAAANYSLDLYTIAPTVKLAYDSVWPSLRGDINGITITAVAGYATAALIPQAIQQAVLVYVKHLWSEGEKAKALLECYDNLVANIRPEVYA